ncbi:unnamed protein product [Rhizoctonia solani]|uniref:Uncharacterized protein n=1 Tax=Rhizoctonia solani TaxID=456999 RepID=A0A8H3BJM9_9AGAM|nr:unnamed protein product [Rhizoctonia solani]
MKNPTRREQAIWIPQVEVRRAGNHDIASINSHVLVWGNEETDGGIYGQRSREPERTRIVVSNMHEFVRVFGVDTGGSANSKEWVIMELVGFVKLGSPASHRALNAQSSLVDFERVGVYAIGTKHDFTWGWSASGLQFMVALQDNTVTVWDVRALPPLPSLCIPQQSGSLLRLIAITQELG